MTKWMGVLVVLGAACGSSSGGGKDVQSELHVTFGGKGCADAGVDPVRISYARDGRTIVETHPCAAGDTYLSGPLPAGAYHVVALGGACYRGELDVTLSAATMSSQVDAVETGCSDAGLPDATPDASFPDGRVADAGAPDGGVTCAPGWSVIGQSGVVGIHAALLGTDQLLFWERPESPANPNTDVGTGSELSVVYGLAPGTGPSNTPVHLQRNAFCAGHAFLPDGRLLVAGGDGATVGTFTTAGLDALRVFTPSASGGSWDDVGTISGARWYPTLVTLPDGRIFMISGTTDDETLGPYNLNPTFETIPPQPGGPTNLPFLTASIPFTLYPFVHVLPSGWLFVFDNQSTTFINYETFAVDARGVAALGNHPRVYPASGTSVLLPLSPRTKYDAEVMVLGGAGLTDRNQYTATMPADDTYARLKVNAAAPTWTALGTLPRPRVMPDAVLLPDGQVLVVNGAAQGHAGGAAGGGAATVPDYPADLYDPATDRWTALGSAQVARLYHSTALLLPDGRVLAAGTDQALAGTPTRPYEYRLEAFTPPSLCAADRPVIAQAPSRIGYGQPFTVIASGAPDRAVLIRNGTTTHGNHMDQRMVELLIDGDTIMGPPSAAIAPPGDYLLFVLRGPVPSVATFVRLVDAPVATSAAMRVGWWKLDEASGTIAADLDGHPATLAGGASFGAGRAGHALVLDGTGRAIATVPTLPSASASRTLAAWFRLDELPAPGTTATLLAWGGTAAGAGAGLSVVRTAGGATALRFAGRQSDVDALASLTPGAWHHVAATYDGIVATLYLDGRVLASLPAPDGDTAASELHLGEAVDGSARLTGALSDVVIYGRALPPGEIESLVAPVPLAGLVTWLRADRGVVADAGGGVSSWLDASGHEVHARTVTYATDHPTWVQDALAGLPVLRFNGTSNFLRTTSAMPGGSGAYAIFVVARPTASGARGLVGWGSFGVTDRVNAFRLADSGGADPRLDNYWWGNDLVPTPTVPLGTASLLAVTFDGTTRTIYRNGVVLGSDTPTGKDTSPTPGFIGRTLPSELFQGDLAEVLIYDTALSANDRSAIEAYLRAKYQLY